MSFPRKFLFMPVGWEDRGEVGRNYTGISGFYEITCHAFCGNTARIGHEKGYPFLYCPKCLVKIDSLVTRKEKL